jgi:hypothetical protein
MKKLAIVVLLLVGSLSLSVAAGADNGNAKTKKFDSSSTDSSTCGNDWANDTFTRQFRTTDNGDGTFTVREDFKGGFVTIAGPSPGACESGSNHGLTVNAGVEGKFKGFLEGTVTDAAGFAPAACNASPSPCDTTAGFILAVFGTNAKFACVSGPGVCTFKFNYHAGDQGLIYRDWQNASDDQGGNQGDIANA